MNLITKFIILIIIHKTISRYDYNEYYQHPQPYTKAAYFLLNDNEEYEWPQKTVKPYRKRRKNIYYSDSEFDHQPKKIKCKCSCEKCRRERLSYYETQDKCCQACCTYCQDNMPEFDNNYFTQTFSMEFPNCAQLPVLPLFEFEVCEEKEGSSEKKKKDSSEKKNEDSKKEKGSREKEKHSTKKETDSITKQDGTDKEKDSREKENGTKKEKDSREKSTNSTKKDKNSREKSTNSTKQEKDSREKSTDSTKKEKDSREKTTTRIEKEKDSREKTTNSTKKEKDTEEKVTDKTKKNTDSSKKSTEKTKERTSSTKIITKNETSSSKKLSDSTIPYPSIKEDRMFLKHVTKKQCLRNNCLRNNNERKIGRYFYKDLVVRPTIDSYLNIKKRVDKARENFYKRVTQRSYEEVNYYDNAL